MCKEDSRKAEKNTAVSMPTSVAWVSGAKEKEKEKPPTTGNCFIMLLLAGVNVGYPRR
jgi:hypothetical protein